jgi:hypothetical protein
VEESIEIGRNELVRKPRKSKSKSLLLIETNKIAQISGNFDQSKNKKHRGDLKM